VHYKARVLILLHSCHEVCLRSMQLKLGNWKPSQHLREHRGNQENCVEIQSVGFRVTSSQQTSKQEMKIRSAVLNV